MSYPGPPGSAGYPPAQQPTPSYSAPTQQFGKAPEHAPAAQGASQLPVYLTAAVAGLGVLVYIATFFAAFDPDAGVPVKLDLAIFSALLAGLFAGVGLLPKQKARVAPAAVLSVLGFLLTLQVLLTAPSAVSPAAGLYLTIAFTVLQAIVGVAALLFDAGVVSAPAPRPRYEQPQQQYGQYGQPYYGQLPPGGPQAQQPHQQRPGYAPQYGGYQGAPQGGYPQGHQNGPPTPPTGFPAYGQPPSSSAPTAAVPAQPESPSPSNQSAPPPS